MIHSDATGIEHTHVVSLFTIICIRFILLLN